MASGSSVLIVDDREDMVTTLADILEDLGYVVSTAHDGYEALNCVKQSLVNLAIIDIIMPGMNGVQTLKEIKKISPHTSAIMMTAFAVEDLIREAIQEGAFSMISKPLNLKQIHNLIEDCLFSGRLVLIVDDQRMMGEELEDILSDRGYKITIVENGYEAIKKIQEHRYEVILLDLVMPGINGAATLAEIRKIHSNAVVVLYSGYQIEEKLKECIELGAYACFTKPFDPEKLIKIVEEVTIQRRRE